MESSVFLVASYHHHYCLDSCLSIIDSIRLAFSPIASLLRGQLCGLKKKLCQVIGDPAFPRLMAVNSFQCGERGTGDGVWNLLSRS